MKFLFVILFFISTSALAQNKTEILRILNSSNYYEILNVAPEASEAEIKSAYRRLASIYHPDKNPKYFEAANKVMEKLTSAGQTLKNPLKRKAYDLTVKATAPLKPKTSAAKANPTTAKPSANAWQKHQFDDFGAENKKSSTASSEQADGKTESKAHAKPEPDTYEKPKQKAQVQPEPEPVKTSSTTIRESQNIPQTLRAKQAQKMYRDNSSCETQFIRAIDEAI